MKNSDFCEIYVHIPFCVRKCDYCDFVSFACKESVWEEYFKALCRQIELKAETMGKLPVASCFFGGGTPSVPDAEYICKTLNLLREKFKFSDDAEITIEMNPNSASKEKLAMYKEAGINRISIGLQSTENEELKKLTRLHSYEEFLNTYNTARNLGFENINIDLMSAIPGQTLESYSRTLERVIGLNPEHISAYSLILEEGTPFFERYKDETIFQTKTSKGRCIILPRKNSQKPVITDMKYQTIPRRIVNADITLVIGDGFRILVLALQRLLYMKTQDIRCIPI